MRTTAEVWLCELDGCGHFWLAKTETPPAQCGRCGLRGWHKTKTTGELIRDAGAGLEDRLREIVRDELSRYNPPPSLPPTRHNVPEPDILPPARVSMDELRDMAAGILPPPASPSLTVYPGTPCPYTEYDYESGETYRCGLTAHPPKVKHTRGTKL